MNHYNSNYNLTSSSSSLPGTAASASNTTTTTMLDFEALLSREYRPARVTMLVPREAFDPSPTATTRNSATTGNKASGGIRPRRIGGVNHQFLRWNQSEEQKQQQEAARRQRQEAQETSRFVLSLVTQTPAFTRHLPEEVGQRHVLSTAGILGGEGTTGPAGSAALRSTRLLHDLEPQFHPVELGDWESKIDWEGGAASSSTTATATSKDQNDPPLTGPKSDAMALLKKPRNPFLDKLQFDETTVCWDGDPTELMARAQRAPLLLELGVAGQSVARHVYQHTVLSAQRPTPALKSEAYLRRMERKWLQPITSTADVSSTSKGTLHADKDKMEALIEARQRKRAQMAKDKTSRVTEAMGTLALGGGRGRTITSSLMGPGGTERTGRPTKAASSSLHETEYVEQLELVANHTMVRDLSKVMLRQYHRPKLPLSVVREDLCWQFQIRFIPTNKKGDSQSNTSSYQAVVGTHPGAISKAKIRTELDLSPGEGHLVLVEYCEERPPIQLTKGMASKIVNYFRGDRTQCPISAGGGDRPARRKRDGAAGGGNGSKASTGGKLDRLPRLEGPDRKTSITDWIGKMPKKAQKDRTEQDAIDVLPEGVTEILHPKVHGPFIGEVEEGMTVTGLINNLFVAPMFRHEPESFDFLMILTPPSGASRPGQRDSMGVVLREFPSSVFTVGQTEPRTRVYAPNTQGEKNFVGPFVSYQIARLLSRTQAREGHGLRLDELQDRVLPNLELPPNAFRQRLKQVAIYDKNTGIWTTKAVGFEDYPGVDALGKTILPESVAAFEAACAASRRLSDLGMHQLLEKGSNSVMSMGVTMVYLAGQLNAMRELSRKAKKHVELSRSNRSIQALQILFYERAATELEMFYKTLRQKHEVAQFIFEELQLAPWHLTGEFIDVHKKAEGTGMMKLTGLGDPSGQGEGFSFLREADAKPMKAVGTGNLNSQIKKITGTEDDLRKLTMKQMASLLRSYGMAQKQIDTLKRWDRVHVIRDLSTKAASDGIGDGLERFARGEKMKLSEQKQMYRDRIQVIWRRQIAALSLDSSDRAICAGVDGTVAMVEGEVDGPSIGQHAQVKKGGDVDKVESDSDDDDDDDDDLAAALEDEMLDRSEANQLVAAHSRGREGEVGLGQLRAAAQDEDLTKDARELAALKRQREEERAAQEGLQSIKPAENARIQIADRKVIRKRITKTHPDGRQTTTFKFILRPDEVGKTMARLQQKQEEDRSNSREFNYEYGSDEKPPGHGLFEDEDDYELSKGRLSGKRRGGIKRRTPVSSGNRPAAPRVRSLQIGKLRTKVSKEERMKKRKRDEEELEVYATAAKRKGNSNRRERGSIRDRRPHIIFAEKLEAIRAAVEARPFAGPFVKPVNMKLIPRYYEVISLPMDLQTIRDKINRYEYRTADILLRDFELMKSNAIKFNGPTNPIAQEAVAIYDFVRDQIEASRDELVSLEEAVKEQMSGKPKKKKKPEGLKRNSAGGAMNLASVGGVPVNLGDLSQSMHFDGIESGSDESFSGLLDSIK